MIIVITEEKYNTISTQLREYADVIVVLKKEEGVAWIAKNRFGNQRELSVHNVPAFVSSFMQVLGF